MKIDKIKILNNVIYEIAHSLKLSVSNELIEKLTLEYVPKVNKMISTYDIKMGSKFVNPTYSRDLNEEEKVIYGLLYNDIHDIHDNIYEVILLNALNNKIEELCSIYNDNKPNIEKLYIWLNNDVFMYNINFINSNEVFNKIYDLNDLISNIKSFIEDNIYDGEILYEKYDKSYIIEIFNKLIDLSLYFDYYIEHFD